jgi:hypothetical protein
VVWHLFEGQVVAQFGEVLEDRDDAPVIDFQECFEGQDGEQLVLGKVLAAADRRVRGQRTLSQA